MRAAIVSHPIDVAALAAEVSGPMNGAVITFVGAVREQNGGRSVEGIEYAAYTEMAARELEGIVADAVEHFGTPDIIAVHRVGSLAVGEASLAIAVAAPHRRAAYDASRFVLEEIKRRVPIWKREHYTDGTREWVEPAAAAHGSRP